METDKTTLNDLSMFNAEEEFSIFNKLDLTLTSNGRDRLKKDFSTPLNNIEAIKGIQLTLQLIARKIPQWPVQITNGTIKVVEKFYETAFDPMPEMATSFSAYSYKLLHPSDYSLVKYSAVHCFDFLKGMKLLERFYLDDDTPSPLKKILTEAKKILSRQELEVVERNNKPADLNSVEILQLAGFLRYHFKQSMFSLLHIHALLDAWYGMAQAVNKYRLVFPGFVDSAQPFIKLEALYHLLLQAPVAYDVTLDRETNFLFLTGANMAGKSTFIKSVGAAVFLAHIGMGVPAEKMELSLFDGMLSNINVVDNIVKGESYFYNEVQRIKSTIQKINDGRKWFILIDELFKGTNIQDAMKCSTTVIEGLLKIRNAAFILSTHLYEIGEGLQIHPNIHFNYFETTVNGDQLSFNYQLREGISNDRLGYLILKKEGVVKMLEDL